MRGRSCNRNRSGSFPPPADEQAAFAAAHGDLYEITAGRPRLAIRDGRIAIGSLAQPGFAHMAAPDFGSLQPLSQASTFV